MVMRVPGFGPEARAWQARVLPGYTTPAFLKIPDICIMGKGIAMGFFVL